MLRPRLWHTVSHRPVSLRCSPPEEWPYQSPNVVRWTYDPSSHGKRLCLEFATAAIADIWRFRWRTLANALWKIIDGRPQIVFHDIPTDVSDCIDGTLPADVFRFTKLRDDPHALLPNPYLIERDTLRLRPLPWHDKADIVYFRGAATGAHEYAINRRVAACLAARSLPGSDCALSCFNDVGQEFKSRAARDGIVAPRQKPDAMNRYRYLLDIDGHASSWDRYQKIGAYGAVPIRFETEWLECWHDRLVEGVHHVSATRTNLEHVIFSLRDSPSLARDIASQAEAFVKRELNVARMQERLETAWLARTGGQR